LNGRSRLAIPGMLLPPPIWPFYPISWPLKTLQQNLKQIIGDTLRSHSRPAQETETRIAVNLLNRMLDLARPESVRAA
jgi:hypothetical protein